MPQEYPARDHRIGENFYTYEEIRDFTNNFTDLTLVNISKFIEVKTKDKYVVVQKDLIEDVYNQLFHNILYILEIHVIQMGNMSEEIWEKKINTSHILTKKLHDVLNPIDKE